MHFKGHIITNKVPTKERLAKILEKYFYETESDKEFEWDWYTIGGRFGGRIKINFDPNENEDNWYCNHQRNYKYFIIDVLDDIKEKAKYYDELDYLLYMGIRDKILYVDGGYTKDMIDFDITDCYVVIDSEENLYVRESWNGDNWIEDTEFDNKVKEIDLTDKFITVIDFHN